ncbi:hypothetical protein dqs_2949 [Azoarcus olearius]|uniref:rhodanese-like domain-containing protein n=1 Tax=Azoarcus sp. (strain BH72) TaxID=418699 RepID=UPI0008060F8D|nr:rhodanese-like domain-containing protein [Azoarcus olearius]ANQ85977.1 hypothetical protein dqs_2949 [Azoarcus olearius]
MEFLQQNWHWAALAAASGAWLLVDLVRNKGDRTQISPVEATLLINREDAVVVDVRDEAEFTRGHIPNARHLPLNDLTRRSAELEKFKGRPIILYCASGSRSASALAQLKKAGFDKLHNLRGGMMEWEKAGQPITRKKK